MRRRWLDRNQFADAKLGDATPVGLGEATDETQADHIAQLGPVVHEVGDRAQQIARRTVTKEPAGEGKGAVVGVWPPLDRSKFFKVNAIGNHGEWQLWSQATNLCLRVIDD